MTEDDDYVAAPSRQTAHLAVNIKGNRATLSRAAHRFLVASLPDAGVRVRWLLRKDGSGFALEATTDHSGSYSLRSHHVQVAPSVIGRKWAGMFGLTAQGGRLCS